MVQLFEPQINLNAVVDKSTWAPIMVGMTGWRSWSGAKVYLDYAKIFRLSDQAYGAFSDDNVDSLGYPLAIPSGQSKVLLVAEINNSLLDYRTTYTLKWHSELDLGISATTGASVSGKTWDSGTGLGTATVTITANVLLSIEFKRPDNAAGSLGNFNGLHLFPNDVTSSGMTAEEMWDLGYTWHPDVVNMYASSFGGKPPIAVRSMDLNAINGNVAVRDVDFITSRNSANYNHVAPEVLAEFANRTGVRHLWWCIPLRATDDYIVQWATRLKADLNESVVINPEWSNEIWNPGFAQYEAMTCDAIRFWCNAGVTHAHKTTTTVHLVSGDSSFTLPDVGEGAALAGTNTLVIGDEDKMMTVASVVGDVVTLSGPIPAYANIDGDYTLYFGPLNSRHAYHALRLEQIRQLLETVFTDPSRLRTGFGMQAAGSGDIPLMFAAAEWAEYDPGHPDPATRHQWVAPASYFGLGTVTEAMVEQFQTDVDGAVSLLHAAMMTSVQSNAATWETIRALVDGINPDLALQPYEGGLHLQYGGMDLNWVSYDYFDALPLTIEWRSRADLVAEALAPWAQFQIDTASWMTEFVLQGAFSETGLWSIYQTTDGLTDACGEEMIRLASTYLPLMFHSPLVA